MLRISTGQLGDLTKWYDERGFGFVTPADGGGEVFAHISSFRIPGDRRPLVGDRVRFQVDALPDGRTKTRWVELVGVEPPSPVLVEERVPRTTHAIMATSTLAVFGILLLATAYVGRLPFWAIVLYGVASVATIILYWIDKRAALAGRWRLSESVLWLAGLLGGWPGALIAQLALRHKSSKVAFQGVFWVTVIANIGLYLLILHPFWIYA